MHVSIQRAPSVGAVSPRLAWAVAAVGFTGAVLMLLYVLTSGYPALDYDRAHYVSATHRWLTTGTPYLASEVAGPFDYQPDTFLHPPISLLLFLPFTWLPAVLWYAIPIGLTIWIIAGWRPSPTAWAVIAMLLFWPTSASMLVVGNTNLWVMAFVAAGLRWQWPWALIVLKPSFAPFIFGGVRDRSWWVAMAALIAVSLLFGVLWLDWFRVVIHAPGGLTYSILGLPLILVPVAAFLGRRRDAAPATDGAH